MTLRKSPTTRRVDSFDALAEEYDTHFTNSVIGQAQRQSVWRETDRWFRLGQRILEINCGTGVDALHFAARGIQVVACDASAKMIKVAARRAEQSPYRHRVDLRVFPIEEMARLNSGGAFDGVFSNFAGLNCVADLRCVAGDLAQLVRPGGKAVLCLFGRHCLWEITWYGLQGRWQKGFRRVGGKGVAAQLAPGHMVFVQYPSVRAICREFAPHFRLRHWKGVGITVPPSYLEPWAEKFAGLFRLAARVDPFLEGCPGFRALADHVVLVFERVKS